VSKPVKIAVTGIVSVIITYVALMTFYPTEETVVDDV
jgi:hypothetical protein